MSVGDRRSPRTRRRGIAIPMAPTRPLRGGGVLATDARLRALALVLACAGCTTMTPPVPPAATPPPAAAPPATPAPVTPDQRAATPAALTVERKWLQSWFDGTPVVIEQRRDGAVRVAIPREFCFDAGRTTVKPPLAVVLDKMAESLRRVPGTRLALIAAPEDGTAAAPSLALQRGTQVHQYLQSRGVSAPRLGQPTVAVAAAVELRLEATPM